METFKPLNQENIVEKIEKEKVLEMLRANGLEHNETKEMVIRWTEQQVAEVEKENTHRAGIIFNIECADLYIAAGDLLGAIDCLWLARVQAQNELENAKEIFSQISKKADEIDAINETNKINEEENPQVRNEKGQVSATPEELAFAEQWLSDHPVQVETKKGYEQGVAEFENMIALFEVKYPLEELFAIVDLTSDPERQHLLRDPAKEALKPIFEKLNEIKEGTTISDEGYEELKAKWKKISNAVGMINRGIVDHNR